MRLPDLEPGRTYLRDEVEAYIALQGPQSPDYRTDDWSVAQSRFPSVRWQPHKKEWRMLRANTGRRMVVEYRVFPLECFTSWFQKQDNAFAALDGASQDSHSQRVNRIQSLVLGGECALPVWMELHHLPCDPMPVREGNHRLLAFRECGMQDVPVFLLNYEV